MIKAEAGEDGRGARRRGVGINVGQAGLDLGYAMGICCGFGFCEKVSPFGISRKNRLDQGVVGARGLLGDGADSGVSGRCNAAGFGAQFAQNDLEESGFAGPVLAHEAYLVTGGNPRGCPFQEEPVANAIGYIVDMQHGRVCNITCLGRKAPL